MDKNFSALIQTLCDGDLRETMVRINVAEYLGKVTIGQLVELYDTIYREDDLSGVL